MRRLILLGLLAIHAALLGFSARWNFVTVDEVAFIPAGLAHWERGDFSPYRVNPPLPRMIATLPLLVVGTETDYRALTNTPGGRPEFALGPDFVVANGARFLDILFLARLPGIVWSLIGGYLVYRWASELYGATAGFAGLTIWCFGPNVLAHAQLVTPDIPATVCGLGATYLFWRHSNEPSWRNACFAGLVLGIAQLTKFTLLVLYPIWSAWWLLDYFCLQKSRPRQCPFTQQLRQLCLVFLLSVVVVNAGYGFQGSFRPLEEFRFVSRVFAGTPADGSLYFENGMAGNRFQATWLGKLRVPLPADYLLGIDTQRADFEASVPSYLAGEWRHRGWWYYYLYGLAIKVPIGVWVLVAWSLILIVLRHPANTSFKNEMALWLPALAVIVFVSSQTGFSHHMRYVLPAFPFVVVSVSKLGFFLDTRRVKSGCLLGVILLSVILSSLFVYPHSLSYFNEAAGGPNNGPTHLVNSNVDWGQDLLFLKTWVDGHPEAKPLHLAFCHLVDARIVGIEFLLPPGGANGLFPDDEKYQKSLGPRPGYHALSVNYLMGTRFPAHDGQGGLRSIRLQEYSYFRRFRPIAKAGYSIYIYHITLEEANRVRSEFKLPLLKNGD